MADIKSLAKGRAALLHFDPRKLKVKAGLNARDLATEDNRAHIEWLAVSIANEGVKQPLAIFQEAGEVYVSDGHCRLAATMLAISRGVDIKTIPCVPETRGTNDVDRVLSQNIYNSGKSLTPIEQGVNFRKALALGASITDIAKKVGKSAGYVSQMIDFQAAPAEVHNMVKSGEVSASLAAQVIREEGDKAGLETLKTAVKTAKANGKAKATAKHIQREPQGPIEKEKEKDDVLWAELRLRAKGARPKGMTDKALKQILAMLE